MTQRISICDSLLKRFWNWFISETSDYWRWKVDSYITTLIEKDRGWSRMNQPRQHQKLRITKKRLCCQFGEIIKKFCTLNFYQEIKRLILTSTFTNSLNWAMQFKKSGQNWQIVRMLSTNMMMQSLTHFWSLVKNYWS